MVARAAREHITVMARSHLVVELGPLSDDPCYGALGPMAWSRKKTRCSSVVHSCNSPYTFQAATISPSQDTASHVVCPLGPSEPRACRPHSPLLLWRLSYRGNHAGGPRWKIIMGTSGRSRPASPLAMVSCLSSVTHRVVVLNFLGLEATDFADVIWSTVAP